MSWYCRKFCDVIIHITPCSAKVLASQLHPDGPGQKANIFPSVICQDESNGTPHLALASTASHPQGGVVVVIYNKIIHETCIWNLECHQGEILQFQ